MVSHCANPKCAKPLHYLRDGRVFVFDVPDQLTAANGKRTRHVEHFWLCGTCSQTMAMTQSTSGVQLVLRTPTQMRGGAMVSSALAS
ncbi:MAG TPA: hypothetical protein VKT75_05380 [Acidobacteriaceae bacterium]|jgi:hypothetical protein|nr:hypothetical protein [Acidobacteriaceae bacterium]